MISVCRFSSSQNPLCQQTDFSKATQFHSNHIYQSYFIEHITPQNKTSAGAVKNIPYNNCLFGNKLQRMPKWNNGAEQWTFLQFPAPYWISNRAHTITRLGLTRCHSRFGPPADLDPRSKSASGYGPPPPSKSFSGRKKAIWTPSKTVWNIILDVLVEILYVLVRIKVCFWFKTCNWQLEMTLSAKVEHR